MLARSVWQEPAPSIGHHLPGGAFSLEASPAPRRPIGLGTVRVLHALVTSLSGLPHHPTVPTIVLAPWPEGLGWAAYVCTDGAARATAGRTHVDAHLFGRPCNVRCGPLMRLRAPVVEDVGPRDLRIHTRTPLITRGIDARVSRLTGARREGRELDGGMLTSTLSSWLPRRVGLELSPTAVRTEMLLRYGRVTSVRIGGHLGTVRGWEGEFVVRTNAVGEWLWRLGALIGVGARVGFGFGRVEVERL